MKNYMITTKGVTIFYDEDYKGLERVSLEKMMIFLKANPKESAEWHRKFHAVRVAYRKMINGCTKADH